MTQGVEKRLIEQFPELGADFGSPLLVLIGQARVVRHPQARPADMAGLTEGGILSRARVALLKGEHRVDEIASGHLFLHPVVLATGDPIGAVGVVVPREMHGQGPGLPEPWMKLLASYLGLWVKDTLGDQSTDWSEPLFDEDEAAAERELSRRFEAAETWVDDPLLDDPFRDDPLPLGNITMSSVNGMGADPAEGESDSDEGTAPVDAVPPVAETESEPPGPADLEPAEELDVSPEPQETESKGVDSARARPETLAPPPAAPSIAATPSFLVTVPYLLTGANDAAGELLGREPDAHHAQALLCFEFLGRSEPCRPCVAAAASMLRGSAIAQVDAGSRRFRIESTPLEGAGAPRFMELIEEVEQAPPAVPPVNIPPWPPALSPAPPVAPLEAGWPADLPAPAGLPEDDDDALGNAGGETFADHREPPAGEPEEDQLEPVVFEPFGESTAELWNDAEPLGSLLPEEEPETPAPVDHLLAEPPWGASDPPPEDEPEPADSGRDETASGAVLTGEAEAVQGEEEPAPVPAEATPEGKQPLLRYLLIAAVIVCGLVAGALLVNHYGRRFLVDPTAAFDSAQTAPATSPPTNPPEEPTASSVEATNPPPGAPAAESTIPPAEQGGELAAETETAAEPVADEPAPRESGGAPAADPGEPIPEVVPFANREAYGIALDFMSRDDIHGAADAWDAMLEAEPKSNSTLMLETNCAEWAARQNLERFAGDPAAILKPIYVEGQKCFLLAYGSFPSEAEANVAIDNLPEPFRSRATRPIIRSFNLMP